MVRLENVTKIYDSSQAGIQDVCLHIEKGSFVSVIGPSGAGKTTLLRCMNGMMSVSSGKVMVNGQCLSQASGHAKKLMQRQIGMIFQNFCLVNETTVLENVLNARLYDYPFWRVLTGCFSKDSRLEARQCLAKVGLDEKADRKAGSLSGGEQQRTAIARSLMQQCSLLLADEPVASLDPVNADEILALLKQMQQVEQLTVVMNSHNVAQAMQVSNRIIGMRQGRIVFDGRPDALDGAALEAIYGKETAR